MKRPLLLASLLVLGGAAAAHAQPPSTDPDAAPPEPTAEVRPDGNLVLSGPMPLEAMCRAVARAAQVDGTCTMSDHTAPLGGAGGGHVALLWLHVDEDRTAYVVWPRPDGPVDLLQVAFAGPSVNYDEELSVRRLSVARHGRVVVELDRRGRGSSCMEPLAYELRERTAIVCARGDDGEPACTTPIPTLYRQVETRWRDWDAERPYEKRLAAWFRLRVVQTRDGVSLRRAAGRVPPAWRRMLGTRSLEELAERPRDPAYDHDP